MSDERPSRGMEFFASLRGFLEGALKKHPKLTRDEIDEIRHDIEQNVLDYWAGLQIYVPREALKLLLRNEHIYRDYDGTNLVQLSRHYQLSEAALRKIINSMRESRRVTPKPGERLKPEPPPTAEQQQLGF